MADVLLVAQKNSESRLANSDFGDLGDNGDDDALMEKDKNLLVNSYFCLQFKLPLVNYTFIH